MKLIGLVPVRNAESMIRPCLRALARLCDEIIVLDDFSDDHTVREVEKLSDKLKIGSILTKKSWYRDEPGDRNRLLKEGRARGGTHFVVIDADEMFTGSWVMDGTLRKLIAQLAKGDRLLMRWIHPWRSLDYVRWDDSIQAQQLKDVIFCDDGIASYQSDFIHTQRSPAGLRGLEVHTDDRDEGLLHFQYVNWRNVLIKQAWYHCLERVRIPKRPIKTINKRYKASCDETGLRLRPTPAKWLQGYEPIHRDIFDVPDAWRLEQMQGWLQEHGVSYFRGLDIWNPEIWLSPTPEIAKLLKSAARASAQIGLSSGETQVKNQKLRTELTHLKQLLSQAELDRGERGKVIEQQGEKLTKIEGEFDTRLKELKALYASADTLKNERNLLQAQLADLQKNFTAVEQDRIDRGKLIETLGQRIVDLEKLVWLTEQNRDYWKSRSESL